MVNLDLKALAAPIEALRGDVDIAYKRLDKKWKEIAETLSRLPIPCTVSFMYWNDNADDGHAHSLRMLEWRKLSGQRRICDTSYIFDAGGPREDHVKPYEEWSGQQRADLIEHVPDLFRVAEKQIKEFIEATK